MSSWLAFFNGVQSPNRFVRYSLPESLPSLWVNSFMARRTSFTHFLPKSASISWRKVSKLSLA